MNAGGLGLGGTVFLKLTDEPPDFAGCTRVKLVAQGNEVVTFTTIDPDDQLAVLPYFFL